MLKIFFLRTKLTLQKIDSCFFRELQLITILILIDNAYASWSTRFISLKLCVGFSFFDSVSFLLYFIFFFNNSIDSLNLKSHNSLQNKNNKKATQSFAPRLLIFKLQQEDWKFNDICVSWSSPNLTWRRCFRT